MSLTRGRSQIVSRTREDFMSRLDPLLTSAKILKEGSELGPFPGLEVLSGIVLFLLEIIKGMKFNKEGLFLLAQASVDILQNTHRMLIQVTPVAQRVPERNELVELIDTVRSVVEYVTELSRRSRISTLLRGGSVNDTLREYRQRLDRSFTTFTQMVGHEEQQLARAEQQRALEEQRLASLHVAPARWHTSVCLEGTRTTLLQDIRLWARDSGPASKSIFWLADVLGSGKTTVASHMAEEWSKRGELGACFFFSRGHPERRNTAFCSTLCSDLAGWDPGIKSLICEAIGTTPSITSRPFKEQFQTLILHPLKKHGRKTILVIDALDECESDDRTILLDTLIADVLQMPSLVKILVTSRPEWDISHKFSACAQPRAQFHLHGESNESDIHRFVETQLLPMRSPGSSVIWPSDNEIATIAERAAGLFIWASIACKLILDSPDPRRYLTHLISDGSLEPLDMLFQEALSGAVPPSNRIMKENVRIVLAALVTALNPPSIDVIDESQGIQTTERVVKRLGSLLSCDSRSQPIHMLHPSFRDFLTSSERCTDSSFFIDLNDPQVAQHVEETLKPATQDFSGVITRLGKAPVSSGGFCDIWKGRFSDGPLRGCVVAMKVFRLSLDSVPARARKRFEREVGTWSALAHEYILPLLGTCTYPNGVHMVCAWQENGNLVEYLRSNPGASRHNLLWQVAQAIQYLHKGGEARPPIVHGDLKGENVLVDLNGNALLADFGLASLIEDIASATSSTADLRNAGSTRFMAPELLQPEEDNTSSRTRHTMCKRTPMSDIYAFGQLVFQVFTGERPFPHILNDTTVLLQVIAGKQNIRPPQIGDELWNLCTRCWTFEPSRRPIVDEVLEFFADASSQKPV